MQNQKLDIVELIEKSPITRLSQNYQGKFIEKIQEHFTESQQQLFVSSFYTFLNYNSKTDFVIDLENVWKWLGFSRKDPAKVVLEKYFIQGIDYIIFTNKTSDEILAPQVGGAKKNTVNVYEEIKAPEVAGAEKNTVKVYEETISQQPLENKNNMETRGRKTEKILMNLNTFKKLCLKSNTKKADEIHDYFIKLEEITQEIVNEESDDLKLQLLEKDKLIEELENKPETEGFERKYGHAYFVRDTTKSGYHIKLGFNCFS